MKSPRPNPIDLRWVILAGGVGSRLRTITGDMPKCMVPLLGKPLLFHQIDNLVKNGVTSIDFLLGYNAHLILEDIENYCTNLELAFEFFVEEEPLGTGGALLNYWRHKPEKVGLVYGDLFFDLDLDELVRSTQVQNYAWKQIIHPSSHLFDSDIIECDSSGLILNYYLKPLETFPKVKNRTNAGVYFFNQEAIEWAVQNQAKLPRKFDLDRELIPRMHAAGLQAQAVEDLGYCRDLGTPERLEEVERDIKSGITSRKERPMIFLDRDGVINIDSGHINNIDSFILLDGVVEAIRKLNSLGVWLVVVTNQPVIARGDLTTSGLNEIHCYLESILAKEGAYINEVYFCPHHPEHGHLGEIPSLKIHCNCRKPNTGLLESAVKKYPSDLSRSILLGDSIRDQQTAKRFGIEFIGIQNERQPNFSNGKFKPHPSLLDAIADVSKHITS